jgi:DNA polymerase IV
MAATGTVIEVFPECDAAAGHQDCYWPRVVLHVSLKDYFVSVERRDCGGLGGRALVVGDELTGIVVASSAEARGLGARVGMRLDAVRELGTDIVFRAARPRVYAATSARVLRALTVVSADVEAVSHDEFVLDATHAQRGQGSPESMARLVQRLVAEASGGIGCTVGAAGNRFAARMAAAGGGIGVIAPWEARARLRDVPVEALTATAPHIAGFLRRRGARTCGDVALLPVEALERRFGGLGRQLWLASQGRELETVSVTMTSPKSLGHGKVLPPRTTSRRVIETYLRYLCEKLAARMRREGWRAARLYIGLRFGLDDGAAEVFPLNAESPDGSEFAALGRRLLREHWRGEVVTHVQVTASRLHRAGGQLDLFAPRAAARASVYDNRDRGAAVR